MKTSSTLRFALIAQCGCNIGFFAVMPLLAHVLATSHALSTSAIALVLSLRTFSQQGMFLIGGMLTDRFGARATLVCGFALRIVGFLALGFSGTLPWLVLGALCTGIGAALFSPALQVLVSRAGANSARGTAGSFALFNMVGEIGTALGPLVALLSLPTGFAVLATGCVLLFAVLAVVAWRVVPPHRTAPSGVRSGRSRPRFSRRFLAFTIFSAINLVGYNQLYLGLPVELRRIQAPGASIAWIFLGISLLSIACQLPLARLGRRLGPGPTLRTGFGLMTLGFGTLALAALSPRREPWSYLPVGCMVLCFILGHLLVGPTILHLCSQGPEASRGARLGLQASVSGVAVLLTGLVLGPLLEHATHSGVLAALPWALLAVLALLSAAVITRTIAPLTASATAESQLSTTN
ncbi:MFS transporter [Glutamicibacter endophyticus]